MRQQKLKVLHIITQLDLGGAQRCALDIARLLDREKYNLYFLSSYNGILAEEVLDLPETNVIFLSSLKRSPHPLADILSVWRLTVLCKKEGIDLMHTHSSKAGILGRWAARFAGVPIIVHSIHGWSFHQEQPRFVKLFYVFLERITANFTDALIAVSESDIAKGLAHNIAQTSKYKLIRYGINRARFSECNLDVAKKKRELGCPDDAPLVGMIACFKPQKSPLDFIKAAALLIKRNPKIRFIMVGDGILRTKIEKLIKHFNLEENIMLTGWRRDIPEILACLDVMVLTSRWEGLPLVFLEAMCAKVPIVAYDVDGVGEIIRDGFNGFLVAPEKISLLAEKVYKLLDDDAMRVQMVNNGFSYVMNNGAELMRMTKDIDELYSSLISEDRVCA